MYVMRNALICLYFYREYGKRHFSVWLPQKACHNSKLQRA